MDYEEEVDDSFVGGSVNDATMNLVQDVQREQGLGRARSPTPDGSASDISEPEQVVARPSKERRKVKPGRVSKSKSSNITEIAVNALGKETT